MASCSTTRWVSTAPYVTLIVEHAATDNDKTKATLSWRLTYHADSAANTSVDKNYTVKIGSTTKNGTYNIDGKTGTKTIDSGTVTIDKTKSSQQITCNVAFAFNLTWSGSYAGTKSAACSITVAAKTSYTISYNANGGTGAPSAQTKWAGESIKLSTTKPTRSGYTFKGWDDSGAATTPTYQPGATFSNDYSITLHAVWEPNKYIIAFDANGGTGAPGIQTKTHGVTLKLPSTIPTRTNYTFKGWGTTPTATTATYSAGGSYTNNVATTLFAVWELAYIQPRINNVTIVRCNSDGTLSDNGTWGLIEFDWECDKTVKSIELKWESEQTQTLSMTISASGTSGHIKQVFGSGILSADSTYSITLIVTDTNGYTYSFGTLNGTRFVIDFLAGGLGAAFNKPAELEGVLDIGFKTRHYGGLLPLVLDPETDLNSVITPNTYTGANISHYNYSNCPVSSGTFTLLVESCGEDGQIKQTYCSCSKYKPERFVRFYYQSEWGDWLWAGTDEYVLYENSSGSNGTITLDASLSHYRYIEIYFTDNNNKSGGYTKVWSPNGKTICLNIVETSSATSVIFRQTMYTLNGTTMTPNTTVAGYLQFNPSTKVIANSPVGTNYLKIVRVIGRA